MLSYNIEDYIDIDFGPAYKKDNNGNIIKVTLSNFKNNFYIHIREYHLDGDTNKWFPTKSGYAIKAEGLENIMELLEEANNTYNSFFKNKDQLELPLEEE